MKLPFTLDDLNPQEATLILSTRENTPIIVERWSLYYRSKVIKRFGLEMLNTILREQRIDHIAEIIFMMVKDKSIFPTLDDFEKAIASPRDQIALAKVLLASIGIGEPRLEEIQAAMKKAEGVKKPADPKPSPHSEPTPTTGAKSSTRSQTATRGVRRKRSRV